MESPRHPAIDYLQDALPRGLEATYYSAATMVATLSAVSAVFASPQEAPEVQRLHIEHNCHDSVIEDGETIVNALEQHMTDYPQINAFHTLESFVDYGTLHDTPTTIPLARRALTVCLSPDGTEITSITDNQDFRR